MLVGKAAAARLAGIALVVGASMQGSAAWAAEKPGSAYLQCDGQPNNMTTGETAARLLGAVTLLGLLAPQPEGMDPAKRKLGAEGVAACSSLVEGEKAEGNAERRISLILARAVHRIEANDYDGAIGDAGLGRQQAEAAGLMASPYFARSRGLAFDWVESAALLRKGDAAAARAAALRHAEGSHDLGALLGTPTYDSWNQTPSDAELAHLDRRSRALPIAASLQAARLEEFGRFADAARVRDAVVEVDRADNAEVMSSLSLAEAAVAHALAGQRAQAATIATEAKANFDKRRADGKPEANPAPYVELMDFYAIADAAASGDLKAARRLFAARSQWVAVSLGSVMEMNRRLRVGAGADELVGGLAATPDQLWKQRADADMAAMLAKDSDNATLFRLIPASVPASAYTGMSKTVWKTDKSKLIMKPAAGKPVTSPFETMLGTGANLRVAIEAYALHAALLAKSRGQQGFVMVPLQVQGFVLARVLTGNRGAPGLPDVLFNDADQVIAELSPLLPSPDMLKEAERAGSDKARAR